MDNFISYQKPRRDYPAIWYNLKPLANKKARFLKEVNSYQVHEWRNVVKGQVLKIQNVLCPGNQILACKTVLWVFVVYTLAWCSHAYIANIKYPHWRTDQPQRQ